MQHRKRGYELKHKHEGGGDMSRTVVLHVIYDTEDISLTKATKEHGVNR